MNWFGFGNDSDGENLHHNNSTILPPINKSRELKYEQNLGVADDDVKKKVSKRQKNRVISLESSPMSSPSSMSSSSISSIDPHQKSIPSQGKMPQQMKSPKSKQQILIQSQEYEEYKNKSIAQISQEIKQMRKQFVEMNKKLSEMLNLYSMAKTQFAPKELLAPSKSQFYKVQVETNKKIENAQITQLKKLNETQVGVKDKDILLDLQKVLIEMRETLHQAKKQEHDSKLKNHKQDVILQEIIKVNNDNKDNNAVKLLKLQIIYYMKKQNSLKTHQQHLEHEEKLITQNDKHLDLKVEELKKSNKNFYLFDERYKKMKEKYQKLQQKKQNLKKQLQTIKKANEITEQKYARELVNLDNEFRNVIKPKTLKCEEQNQKLQEKINSLMVAYQLNEKNLKEIKYKFSPDMINKNNDFKAKLSRSILKPNLRPKSNLSNQGYLSARGKQTTQIPTQIPLKTIHRQNDKNISITIDVNLENDLRYRSISETSTNIKPRNFFKGVTKKDKNPSLNSDRNQLYSMTIDHSTNFITENEQKMKIQKPKMLKPKMLNGGSHTKR